MPYPTYALADGTLIHIETSEYSGREALTSRTSEEVKRQFDECLGTVRKAARAVRDALEEAQPDEREVEFSLKASVELGGFMVAKSSGEGAYSIKLKWKKSEKEEIPKAKAD